MTRYVFLFFVLLWTGVVNGEEIPAGFKATDANLFGHVVDKKTGEHLPYFTVFLKGTTIGSVTEASGHYYLKNLPEGSFVLVAKSVGYKTVERQVTLKRGVTQEVNFEVEEDLVALDEVGGVTIVHAHPFQQDDSAPFHTHSQAEFQLYHVLSSLNVGDDVVPHFIFGVLPNVVVAEVSVFVCEGYALMQPSDVSLRAPPVC